MADNVNRVSYTAPPTISAFIRDYLPGELFYNWIVGPFGSGKTTGLFFKLAFMARLQKPGPDGIRRTRAVVVRNTANQLKDTTLVSWDYWFKDGIAGEWFATDKRFILRSKDIECEVLFRALDTPQDIARVLSLEVTFGIIDEFVQIPRAIIDALSARCGRFPPEKDGGATNWGMWGCSNPSTEDNWWFDFLHDNPEVDAFVLNEDPESAAIRRSLGRGIKENTIIKYFLQPSGFAPNAENWENLPGKRGYYTNQAKGKSDAWIKQYLEAEWGYSIAGQAVIATFGQRHIAKNLRWNPLLPLVAGFDPGLGGSAFIFGQLGLNGVLYVIGELVQSGYGTQRLIKERLRPYLATYFPGLTRDMFIIAPDPAAKVRTGNDEKSIIKELERHFIVRAETNNRLPLRLDALDYYTTRNVEGGPAFQVDQFKCPIFIRALKGGWRYGVDIKKEIIKGAEPEKNAYSHSGDGGGYLARYFHRQVERESKFGVTAATPAFVPPRKFGPSYHVR